MTSSTDCHASGILMILPSPRSSVAAAGVGRPLQALRSVRSIVEPPASEGEPKASALGRHDDEREVVVDRCAVIIGSVLLDGIE